MQDVPPRQLIALGIALAAMSMAPRVFAGESRSAPASADPPAKLAEAPAVVASGKEAELWKKMDQDSAALVAHHPQDALAHNFRAEFLWMSGQREPAIAEWETGERLDPKNALILGHLGGAALDEGEMRKSATYYGRALDADPRNASAHFALANLQFLFRHELTDAEHPDANSLLTGSLGHFAEASHLAPENSDYARAYAETFYSVPSPDWAAALGAWEHFFLLSPQKDFARLNLARVHLKLGQWEAARKELSAIESDTYQRLKLRLGAQIDAQAILPRKTAPTKENEPGLGGPENSSKPVIDDRPHSP